MKKSKTGRPAGHGEAVNCKPQRASWQCAPAGDTARSLHNTGVGEVAAAARRIAKETRTAGNRALFEKLTVPQPFKKFPTFYGTRRLITTFTTARHLYPSWASWNQSTPPTIHFNSILPSMPRSSKWPLSLGSPSPQKTRHISLSSHKCHKPPRHLINFIWTEEYLVWERVAMLLAPSQSHTHPSAPYSMSNVKHPCAHCST